MSRNFVLAVLLMLGLFIGLSTLLSATADANPQYCCCETSCHALGTCEKTYDWEEVGECANDVYCTRSCTESSRDACGALEP